MANEYLEIKRMSQHEEVPTSFPLSKIIPLLVSENWNENAFKTLVGSSLYRSRSDTALYSTSHKSSIASNVANISEISPFSISNRTSIPLVRKVNSMELLSTIADAMSRACLLIRYILRKWSNQRHSSHGFDSGVEYAVTSAVNAASRLMISSLKQYWGNNTKNGLKIVYELANVMELDDDSGTQNHNINNDDDIHVLETELTYKTPLERNLLSRNLFFAVSDDDSEEGVERHQDQFSKETLEKEEYLNMSDIVIYIDPLHTYTPKKTKLFNPGHRNFSSSLSCSTIEQQLRSGQLLDWQCYIGISYRKSAFAGIHGLPFPLEHPSHPQVFYGQVGLGVGRWDLHSTPMAGFKAKKKKRINHFLKTCFSSLSIASMNNDALNRYNEEHQKYRPTLPSLKKNNVNGSVNNDGEESEMRKSTNAFDSSGGSNSSRRSFINDDLTLENNNKWYLSLMNSHAEVVILVQENRGDWSTSTSSDDDESRFSVVDPLDWKTCAPIAMLLATGGKVTDMYGRCIRYEPPIVLSSSLLPPSLMLSMESGGNNISGNNDSDVDRLKLKQTLIVASSYGNSLLHDQTVQSLRSDCQTSLKMLNQGVGNSKRSTQSDLHLINDSNNSNDEEKDDASRDLHLGIGLSTYIQSSRISLLTSIQSPSSQNPVTAQAKCYDDEHDIQNIRGRINTTSKKSIYYTMTNMDMAMESSSRRFLPNTEVLQPLGEPSGEETSKPILSTLVQRQRPEPFFSASDSKIAPLSTHYNSVVPLSMQLDESASADISSSSTTLSKTNFVSTHNINNRDVESNMVKEHFHPQQQLCQSITNNEQILNSNKKRANATTAARTSTTTTSNSSISMRNKSIKLFELQSTLLDAVHRSCIMMTKVQKKQSMVSLSDEKNNDDKAHRVLISTLKQCWGADTLSMKICSSPSFPLKDETSILDTATATTATSTAGLTFSTTPVETDTLEYALTQHAPLDKSLLSFTSFSNKYTSQKNCTTSCEQQHQPREVPWLSSSDSDDHNHHQTNEDQNRTSVELPLNELIIYIHPFHSTRSSSNIHKRKKSSSIHKKCFIGITHLGRAVAGIVGRIRHRSHYHHQEATSIHNIYRPDIVYGCVGYGIGWWDVTQSLSPFSGPSPFNNDATEKLPVNTNSSSPNGRSGGGGLLLLANNLDSNPVLATAVSCAIQGDDAKHTSLLQFQEDLEEDAIVSEQLSLLWNSQAHLALFQKRVSNCSNISSSLSIYDDNNHNDDFDTKWVCCTIAQEAILTASGGRVTNLLGDVIIYQNDPHPTTSTTKSAGPSPTSLTASTSTKEEHFIPSQILLASSPGERKRHDDLLLTLHRDRTFVNWLRLSDCKHCTNEKEKVPYLKNRTSSCDNNANKSSTMNADGAVASPLEFLSTLVDASVRCYTMMQHRSIISNISECDTQNSQPTIKSTAAKRNSRTNSSGDINMQKSTPISQILNSSAFPSGSMYQTISMPSQNSTGEEGNIQTTAAKKQNKNSNSTKQGGSGNKTLTQVVQASITPSSCVFQSFSNSSNRLETNDTECGDGCSVLVPNFESSAPSVIQNSRKSLSQIVRSSTLTSPLSMLRSFSTKSQHSAKNDHDCGSDMVPTSESSATSVVKGSRPLSEVVKSPELSKSVFRCSSMSSHDSESCGIVPTSEPSTTSVVKIYNQNNIKHNPLSQILKSPTVPSSLFQPFSESPYHSQQQNNDCGNVPKFELSTSGEDDEKNNDTRPSFPKAQKRCRRVVMSCLQQCWADNNCDKTATPPLHIIQTDDVTMSNVSQSQQLPIITSDHDFDAVITPVILDHNQSLEKALIGSIELDKALLTRDHFGSVNSLDRFSIRSSTVGINNPCSISSSSRSKISNQNDILDTKLRLSDLTVFIHEDANSIDHNISKKSEQHDMHRPTACTNSKHSSLGNHHSLAEFWISVAHKGRPIMCVTFSVDTSSLHRNVQIVYGLVGLGFGYWDNPHETHYTPHPGFPLSRTNHDVTTAPINNGNDNEDDNATNSSSKSSTDHFNSIVTSPTSCPTLSQGVLHTLSISVQAATTTTHSTNTDDDNFTTTTLKTTPPRTLLVDGVGRKLLMLMEGKVSFVLLHEPAHWGELCGGHALLLAAAGSSGNKDNIPKVTDLFGKELMYYHFNAKKNRNKWAQNGGMYHTSGVMASTFGETFRHDEVTSFLQSDEKFLRMLMKQLPPLLQPRISFDDNTKSVIPHCKMTDGMPTSFTGAVSTSMPNPTPSTAGDAMCNNAPSLNTPNDGVRRQVNAMLSAAPQVAASKNDTNMFPSSSIIAKEKNSSTSNKTANMPSCPSPNSKMVNVVELLSTVLDVSSRACTLIRRMGTSNNCFSTKRNSTVQNLISECIQRHWGSDAFMIVRGHEKKNKTTDKSNSSAPNHLKEMNMSYEPDKILLENFLAAKSPLNRQLFHNHEKSCFKTASCSNNDEDYKAHPPQSMNARQSDITIFINPMETADDLMCLIGISYKGRAVAGVCGIPFLATGTPSGNTMPEVTQQQLPFTKMHFVYGLLNHGVGWWDGGLQPPTSGIKRNCCIGRNGSIFVSSTEAITQRSSDNSGRNTFIQTGKRHAADNPALSMAATRAISSTVPGSHQQKVLETSGCHKLMMRMLSSVEYEPRNDLSLFLDSTYLWDTCAPEAILVSWGGTVTDLFGGPLVYYCDNQNDSTMENIVVKHENTLGVFVSCPRDAISTKKEYATLQLKDNSNKNIHEKITTRLRADTKALELLKPYTNCKHTEPQCVDIARNLDGLPLSVDWIANSLSSSLKLCCTSSYELLSYSAPEREAIRGIMTNGCRLHLKWGNKKQRGVDSSQQPPQQQLMQPPQTVFYKRIESRVSSTATINDAATNSSTNMDPGGSNCLGSKSSIRNCCWTTEKEIQNKAGNSKCLEIVSLQYPRQRSFLKKSVASLCGSRYGSCTSNGGGGDKSVELGGYILTSLIVSNVVAALSPHQQQQVSKNSTTTNNATTTAP